MALISCPECGRPISDIAKRCPGCGYPLNLQQVKSSITNDMANIKVKNNNTSPHKIILIIFLFSLTMCGFWAISDSNKSKETYHRSYNRASYEYY